MTIPFSGAREEMVRSLMQGGRYASEDEVIDEALRLLEERDEQAKLDHLRRELAVGIEQVARGETAPFDPQATLERVPRAADDGRGGSLMASVRRSPAAEADLESILDDLDRNDPAVAARYASAFEQKGDALARFPESGRARLEIAPDLRSTLVRPYVLFYRVAGEEVQIIRILHGKQDLKRIMRAEGEG